MPPVLRAVVKNGVKTCAAFASEIPEPSSATVTTIARPEFSGPGAIRTAMDVFVDFRGREPDLGALLRARDIAA